MNRPELDYNEIAARIHGFYMETNPSSDYEEFAKLPEFMKADNREAALRIGEVLAMAGLRLEPRDGTDWSEADQKTIRQVIEDNLQLLAEAEHDGWTVARLRHGWKLGVKKDLDRREHHLLVRYPQLTAQVERKQQATSPELHKQGTKAGSPMTAQEEAHWEMTKDQNAVRKYIDIIARTNYRIVVER